MQYLILSKDQIKELLADVEAKVEDARQEGFAEGCQVGYGDRLEGLEMARQEGYDAGRAAEAELSETAEEIAYDLGYDYGKAKGYDEGYSDGVADSYDDGYEDGRAEAELRAAESAAFDEQPRIHEWTEGTEH